MMLSDIGKVSPTPYEIMFSPTVPLSSKRSIKTPSAQHFNEIREAYFLLSRAHSIGSLRKRDKMIKIYNIPIFKRSRSQK